MFLISEGNDKNKGRKRSIEGERWGSSRKKKKPNKAEVCSVLLQGRAKIKKSSTGDGDKEVPVDIFRWLS